MSCIRNAHSNGTQTLCFQELKSLSTLSLSLQSSLELSLSLSLELPLSLSLSLWGSLWSSHSLSLSLSLGLSLELSLSLSLSLSLQSSLSLELSLSRALFLQSSLSLELSLELQSSLSRAPSQTYQNSCPLLIIHFYLAAMLRSIISTCCLGCNNVTFVGPRTYLRKFHNPNASVVMPVETSKSSTQFFGRDFVYFLEVPAVSFLLKSQSHSASELTTDLFKSVLSTWPLFITALLMAIIAGIAVWMLVSASFIAFTHMQLHYHLPLGQMSPGCYFFTDLL